jgi:hypothetical protein
MWHSTTLPKLRPRALPPLGPYPASAKTAQRARPERGRPSTPPRQWAAPRAPRQADSLAASSLPGQKRQWASPSLGTSSKCSSWVTGDHHAAGDTTPPGYHAAGDTTPPGYHAAGDTTPQGGYHAAGDTTLPAYREKISSRSSSWVTGCSLHTKSTFSGGLPRASQSDMRAFGLAACGHRSDAPLRVLR